MNISSIPHRSHIEPIEPSLYYTNNTISSNHYRTYRTTLISLSNLLSNLYRAHNAKNQKTHHINEMNLGTTQKCQKTTQNRISFGKKKLPCDFGFLRFRREQGFFPSPSVLTPSFLRQFLRKCERMSDFNGKCERVRVIFEGFCVIFE